MFLAIKPVSIMSGIDWTQVLAVRKVLLLVEFLFLASFGAGFTTIYEEEVRNRCVQ